MNELELVMFVKYKDDGAFEVIEIEQGEFTEDLLTNLTDRLETLATVLRHLKLLDAVNTKVVDEIYVELQDHIDEDEIDILEQYSIQF